MTITRGRRYFTAAGVALFIGGCASGNQSARQEEKPATLQPEEAPAPKMHGPKKRIGVVDFEDAAHGYHSTIANVARDVTTELLVKSGAFVVIEREQIA